MDQEKNSGRNPAKSTTDRRTTPKEKDRKIIIYDLLPMGKENRVASAELMRQTGITDQRQLRRQIRTERIAGKLIASTTERGGGYYVPGSLEEVKEFLEQMEHRAKGIFFTVKGTREAVKGGADDSMV